MSFKASTLALLRFVVFFPYDLKYRTDDSDDTGQSRQKRVRSKNSKSRFADKDDHITYERGDKVGPEDRCTVFDDCICIKSFI